MSKRKKEDRNPSVLGILSIQTPELIHDELGRLTEQPDVLAVCAKVSREMKRLTAVESNIKPPMGVPGSYQIDCLWKNSGQFDALAETDDPRVIWYKRSVEKINEIRANAMLRKPKLAAELGVDKKTLGLYAAFAEIARAGRSMLLVFPESGRSEPIPLPSATEIGVLKSRGRKDPYVDGLLHAVGADEIGGILIYAQGVKRPIYVNGYDDDTLHALRKRGTHVRGSLKKQGSLDYLEDPRFLPVGRQEVLET